MQDDYENLSPPGAAKSRLSGYALLLMLLVIMVIGAVIWLDPSALLNRGDPNLPWNQESRLVRPGRPIQPPVPQQPNIDTLLVFTAPAVHADADRGEIMLGLAPDGRIEGTYSGEYRPTADLHRQVMACRFRGNIDSSKIYSDKQGPDHSKLFFIAKGTFLILETNSRTSRVRSVKGYIYVTGWLDTEYYAAGEITITSDKRTFETFTWQAQASEHADIPFSQN